MSGAGNEEKEAILSDDSLPSSPTASRVIDLASPSETGRFSYADAPTTSLPHTLQAHDEAEEAKAEADATHPSPPYTAAASADLSRQAEVTTLPTGPGPAIQSAIAAATSSSPPSDTTDPQHRSTHQTTSARTASLKAVNSAANVKQPTPGALEVDSSDVALDAIPSLDDYVRYLEVLQKEWKDAPVIDVAFDHLSYIVKVAADETAIPSIDKAFIDFFKMLTFQRPPPINLAVFNDCTGTVPHGQMTLVLAPPGAGKSQFLKALAGRLRKDKRVTGDLWYNGLTADEQLAAGQYVEKLCALVAQGDVHMANLTVRETLKFALDSSVADPALLHPSDPRLVAWHRRKVDLLLSVLGMHECADTIAGNAVIRGISGGQKKRLTIGEFMITNARLILLDEPTTGLDAAVARDIMQVLRQWCEISGSTVIAALLQPTPECYELYDQVILMKEGHIVYQGPRTDIPHFLWFYHGLEVDPEQDTADFLVDWMTDPALVYQRQRRRWNRKGGPKSVPHRITREEEQRTRAQQAEQAKDDERAQDRLSQADVDEERKARQDAVSAHRADVHGRAEEEEKQAMDKTDKAGENGSGAPVTLPSTAGLRLTNEEMVAAYHSSPYYAEQQVAVGKVRAERGDGGNAVARVKSTADGLSTYTKEQYSRLYARSFMQHCRASLSRQFTLISRDKQTIPPRLFSSVLIGVILGSLFLRLPLDDFYGRFGMLLFALLNSAMGNFTELPAAFEGRNAVYKHIDAGMYPPLSYLLSVVAGFFPVMILETILFSVVLYFMVGLAAEVGRFFFFFLVLLITDVMLAGLYRGVCYTTATIDHGQQVLNPVFNMMIVFGGFLITRDKIPNFLIEFYWLTPISWAMRSLVQNEFKANEYDALTTYNGQQMTVGDSYLLTFEVQTDSGYKWGGIGYMLGFFAVSMLSASYLLVTVRFDLLQGTKRKNDELGSGSIVAANGAGKTPSLQTIDIPAPQLARGQSGQRSSRVINATFAIPFQPMSLVFTDLHYTVKVKNAEKQTVDRKLLNGISGYVKPGQLTALMGASGAGKTTLMDVIAGRKTSGKIEGDIRVNGAPQDAATYRRISAYVEQQDSHMPLATVRESMLFSAQLRLPKSVDVTTREAFVDQLIDLLELTSVKDRIVGNENYVGLSPGQLKLLTIGVELVSNPSILFLDEPTSGLDSRAALIVMRVVKNIAATGRTVLCTIHQPSAEVFYLFDYLLLLKSGGETVYFGPVGEDGETIVEYFEYDGRIGDETGGMKRRVGGPRRPKGMNPASWMLDVIGAGVAGALSRAQEKHQGGATKEADKDTANETLTTVVNVGAMNYAQLYPQSKLWAGEAQTAAKLGEADPEQRVEVRLSDYEIPWYYLLWIVVRRGFLSSWRDSKTNFGRITTLIFLGLIFGLIFLQIDASDYAGVNSKLAAIFSMIGFGGMLQNQLALPSVIAERSVFYRERASDSYSSWMYSVTLGLVEIPYIAFSILLFVLPYYFMVGFNNDASDFFKFYLSVFCLAITLSSFGQWAGATFPSFVAAIQASGLLVTFWFLFGGIFIHPVSIPRGWYWFYVLNPIPKALIACALPQFECHLPNPYDTSSGCPVISVAQADGTNMDMTIHSYINQQLDAGYDTYGKQIAYLLCFFVFFRILCALSLKYISHLKRYRRLRAYAEFSIIQFDLPYYFMVGFNNDASDFFKFYLSVFCLAITLSSFGQWAGATFPSFVAAIQASGLLVTFAFLTLTTVVRWSVSRLRLTPVPSAVQRGATTHLR